MRSIATLILTAALLGAAAPAYADLDTPAPPRYDEAYPVLELSLLECDYDATIRPWREAALYAEAALVPMAAQLDAATLRVDRLEARVDRLRARLAAVRKAAR